MFAPVYLMYKITEKLLTNEIIWNGNMKVLKYLGVILACPHAQEEESVQVTNLKQPCI